MSLAERLRAALRDDPSEPLFDGDDPGRAIGDAIPAAVLIGVTDRPEPGVLLTVRRADLRTHAGQVAFPGGRIDAGEDATAAAVREAWEELGIDPAGVEPIAVLETYRTVTGFAVTPVLATVRAGLSISPHDGEVADWFEAPLAHLVDPANHVRHSALFRGAMRHYWEIPWRERKIWGATAAMLVNLSRRLDWR